MYGGIPAARDISIGDVAPGSYIGQYLLHVFDEILIMKY